MQGAATTQQQHPHGQRTWPRTVSTPRPSRACGSGPCTPQVAQRAAAPPTCGPGAPVRPTHARREAAAITSNKRKSIKSCCTCTLSAFAMESTFSRYGSSPSGAAMLPSTSGRDYARNGSRQRRAARRRRAHSEPRLQRYGRRTPHRDHRGAIGVRSEPTPPQT